MRDNPGGELDPAIHDRRRCSYCTNALYRLIVAVQSPLLFWRDKFTEGSNYLVAPNCLTMTSKRVDHI